MSLEVSSTVVRAFMLSIGIIMQEKSSMTNMLFRLELLF